MRSLITRLALVGIVGVAVAGCGTGMGSSLPVGGTPNSSGGGPTGFTNQAPAPGTEPGLLIDGGTKAFTGYNTTAVDTLAPTPAQATDTAGRTAPADVAGSHTIVYSGNGLTQQIFSLPGTFNLTLPAATPGDFLTLDYGAVVFFATSPATASSLSIELTGGANASAFDARLPCTGTAATGRPQTTRYVCVLPAFGTTAGTAPFNLNFPNAVTSSSTTGSFTPTAARFFVVVNDTAPLASTSTANTLAIDYIYAEQGTT